MMGGWKLKDQKETNYVFNKLIENLTQRLMTWCEKRRRVMYITGTGGPEDVYLIRYYVLRSRFFNVFIHQFLRSDRDDLHDHPWNFVTYLVRGGYTERKWNEQKHEIESIRRYSGGNSLMFVRQKGAFFKCMDYVDVDLIEPKSRLIFRWAEDQHQVLTDHDYRLSEKVFAPLTICITGRTAREWGFVKSMNDEVAMNGITIRPAARKWIPWREYLGLPPDTPGRG